MEHKGSCCVDAGFISVFDEAFLKNMASTFAQPEDDLCFFFDIEPGTYKIKAHIPTCWEGEVTKEVIMEVKGPRLIISDPCYWINDDKEWDAFMQETDYFTYDLDGLFSLGTGDGGFEVELVIEKVGAPNVTSA